MQGSEQGGEGMKAVADARHLVIGLGEVGAALRDVLKPHYGVKGLDKKDGDTNVGAGEKFDVIHVCFPPSPDFVADVQAYAAEHLAEGGLVIVHSSVPVGTTLAIGDDLAVHSPVRGVHPKLAEGIRGFVKYFGGKRCDEAAVPFSRIGIQTCVDRDSRNTEAMKLWDTTQYGVQILLEKAVHAYCAANGLSFDLVYTDANRSYNAGYETLGMPHVRRPVLRHVPGGIGGHCVIANAEQLDSWLAKMLVQMNEEMFAEEVDGSSKT